MSFDILPAGGGSPKNKKVLFIFGAAALGVGVIALATRKPAGDNSAVMLESYPEAPIEGGGALVGGGDEGLLLADFMDGFLDSQAAYQQANTQAMLEGLADIQAQMDKAWADWLKLNPVPGGVVTPLPTENAAVIPPTYYPSLPGAVTNPYIIPVETDGISTRSTGEAYHPGVVVGPTSSDYITSWNRTRGYNTDQLNQIIAISRSQGVDMGIAEDMFKTPGGTASGSRTTSGSRTSSGGSSSGTSSGSLNLGKGAATGAAAASNESRLNSDSSFVASEKTRTAQVIADRERAGLDTSAQRAYQNRLNTGSWY